MEDSLSFSQRVESTGVFPRYYRNLFGEFFHGEEFQTDLSVQRRGIDRIIKLNDGEIKVDEKVDMFPRETIFLEFWSAFESNQLGWFHTSEADYTVYTFPNGEVYWIPMKPVRRVWRAKIGEWMAEHGDHGKPFKIINDGKRGVYTAYGVGIPKYKLMVALDEMVTAEDDGLWKSRLSSPVATMMGGEETKLIADVVEAELARSGRKRTV